MGHLTISKQKGVVVVFLSVLMVVSFCLCIAQTAEARTIYVDNSYYGDELDGTEEHPYVTVNDALTDLAENNEGDVVIEIAEGDRAYEERFVIGPGYSGLPEHKNIIMAKEGDSPVLASTEGSFFINGRYFIIKGLTFDIVSEAWDENAPYVIIRACEQLEFESNTIEGHYPDQQGDGIHLESFGSNVIKDNEIINTATGIRFYTSGEALIENNDIHHNGIYGIKGIGNVRDRIWNNDVLIRKNRIYRNETDGIYMQYPYDYMYIEHNTIVANGVNGITFSGPRAYLGSGHAIVTGNIIAHHDGYSIDTGRIFLKRNYNCYWENERGLKTYAVDGNNFVLDRELGVGSIDENPLFVDYEEDDYHLWSRNDDYRIDSRCIDAGDPNERFDEYRSFTDMGCYAYERYRIDEMEERDIIYVDNSAEGNNDGTSWEDAYTTINAALNDLGSERPERGVEIRVAEGNGPYAEVLLSHEVRISGRHAGAPGAYNMLLAKEGEQPTIIPWTDERNTYGAIPMYRTQYFGIKGFRIALRTQTYRAIVIEASDHIIIEDNIITEIVDNKVDTGIGFKPGFHPAHFDEYNLSDIIVRYNTISNVMTGIAITGTNIHIKGNRIHDVRSFGIINYPGIGHIIEENLIYRVSEEEEGGYGIWVFFNSTTLSNVSIVNNTIDSVFSNGEEPPNNYDSFVEPLYYGGIRVESRGGINAGFDPDQIVRMNSNIITNCDTPVQFITHNRYDDEGDGDGAYERIYNPSIIYNCAYDNEVEFPEIEDAHDNIDQNPLFVDVNDDDYHLQDRSPCIDAGDPDLEDADESRRDIGCYYPGSRVAEFDDWEYEELQEVEPPVVDWPEEVIEEAVYLLQGEKARDTAVWINNVRVVNLNNEETWEYEVDLDPGINVFEAYLTDADGNESEVVRGEIERLMLEPPVVNWPEDPVVGETYLLDGEKAPGTAVYINDEEVVAINNEATWEDEVDLEPGINEFEVYLVNANDNRSEVVRGEIERIMVAPPVVFWPEEPVDGNTYLLQGEKAQGTAVWINNVMAVDIDNEDTWEYSVRLRAGINNFEVYLVDAEDNQSSSVFGEIERQDMGGGQEDGERIEQTLQLTEGWNMISFNVLPDTLDISELFAPLVDEGYVSLIKDGPGNFYKPQYNYDGLNPLNLTQGYQVNVTRDCQLRIEGAPVEVREITLTAKWQIIGFPLRDARDADQLLAQLRENNISYHVKNGAGKFIIHGRADYQGFDTFDPGQGYKIQVSEDCVLNLNE